MSLSRGEIEDRRVLVNAKQDREMGKTIYDMKAKVGKKETNQKRRLTMTWNDYTRERVNSFLGYALCRGVTIGLPLFLYDTAKK